MAYVSCSFARFLRACVLFFCAIALQVRLVQLHLKSQRLGIELYEGLSGLDVLAIRHHDALDGPVNARHNGHARHRFHAAHCTHGNWYCATLRSGSDYRHYGFSTRVRLCGASRTSTA